MTSRLLLTAGLLAASAAGLQAQNPMQITPISFNEVESFYTNNFNTYTGRLATLPQGVQSNFQTYLGKGDGASASEDAAVAGQGGYHGYHPTAFSADVSLGLQNDGGSPMYYDFTFKNDGQTAIRSVRVSYDFEQYRYVNTSTGIVVSSVGLPDLSALNQNGQGPANNPVGGVVKSTPKSIDLPGVTIAAGASFTVRFQANAFDANGNNGVGVDNIAVSVSYDVPLPVKLVAFTATPAQAGATLNWTTASERDNAFFGVEMSRDGVSFEEMGRVNGAGTQESINEYEFSLASLDAGTVYFRLAQTDFDGAVTYSPITSALIAGKKKGFSVLANYVTNELQLSADDASTATIVDISGRQVRQVRLVPGRQAIDVADLSTGMYFLSNGETTVRFVK